jgi:hypothetical protein
MENTRALCRCARSWRVTWLRAAAEDRLYARVVLRHMGFWIHFIAMAGGPENKTNRTRPCSLIASELALGAYLTMNQEDPYEYTVVCRIEISKKKMTKIFQDVLDPKRPRVSADWNNPLLQQYVADTRPFEYMDNLYTAKQVVYIFFIHIHLSSMGLVEKIFPELDG